MSVNERWFGTGAYLLQLMNRIGRRTAYAMLVILALVIVWQIQRLPVPALHSLYLGFLM
jgi:hypothetical protein